MTPATIGGANADANFLAGTDASETFEFFAFCQSAKSPIEKASAASTSQTISQFLTFGWWYAMIPAPIAVAPH